MEPGRNDRLATGMGRERRREVPELLGRAEGFPECECVRTGVRGR